MSAKPTPKQRLRRIVFFFPIQLLFLHLKRNHLLLVVWVILFGVVTRSVGMKYGVPYLFLTPEYLGESDFVSHAIMGFSIGGFIMAFNIYSYVMHGYLFPFIATLARPFLKFSINNFIIPGSFLAVYLWKASVFQAEQEFIPPTDIIWNMLGLVCGVTIFFLLSVLYFFRTNKNIYKLSGKTEKDFDEEAPKHGNVLHKKSKWYDLKGQKGWLVLTYMSSFMRVKLARDAKHYDNALLQKVFNQNYINASLFEVLMLITFIVIGSFREVPLFEVPAGASIILLFTILLMLFSALYSWLKGWTLSVLVVLFLLLNWGSSRFDFMSLENHAYGLNYEDTRADYSNAHLLTLRDDEVQIDEDRKATLEVLERWRQRNLQYATNGEKPKLVIVTASGGGLRSALWTYHLLQHADSVLGNDLLRRTHLITGSSGGMVGASYLREVYLRSLTDESYNIHDPQYRDRISRDILNPIGFSIATNDIFIRYQNVEDGGFTYTKDRATSFEYQLNENTNNLLDKRLRDYAAPERNAQIPTMVLAPTIVNDARRLIISAQPMAYLMSNHPDENLQGSPVVENIEFRRLFAEQGADNLKFTSALRMNATFPYILPTVSLPSTPRVEVMDAGLRDNFGLVTTFQYLWEFRHWIAENTSGVVIVQVRDTDKQFEVDREVNSLFGNMVSPAGSLYGNFARIQDYNQDLMLQHASGWCHAPVEIVNFQLREDADQKVSLSWHLTKFEKQRILLSIDLEENVAAMERLKQSLGVKP